MEALQFLMWPTACGLSCIFGIIVGYKAGKRKMKTERDLHLKGRVVAEEARDKAEGKLAIVKGVFKNT